MRMIFDANERSELAQQLGVSEDEQSLAAAVAARLQQRDEGDMSDIDKLPDRTERIRLKQERIQAAQRREHTPSDADERGFSLDEGDYPSDWLTQAERAHVEQRRVQAQQARRRGGSSIMGFQPKVGRKPVAGRITFGSGVVVNPKEAV